MLPASGGLLVFRMSSRLRVTRMPVTYITGKQRGNHNRSPSKVQGFSSAANSKRPPFNPASGFRLTDPPNTQWKYGEGYGASVGAEEWAQGEEEGWKELDTSKMSPR